MLFLINVNKLIWLCLLNIKISSLKFKTNEFRLQFFGLYLCYKWHWFPFHAEKECKLSSSTASKLTTDLTDTYNNSTCVHSTSQQPFFCINNYSAKGFVSKVKLQLAAVDLSLLTLLKGPRRYGGSLCDDFDVFRLLVNFLCSLFYPVIKNRLVA